jgi:soluble P-type ATPase
MKLKIPNSKEIILDTLILDLNGTLTVKGELIKGVDDRLKLLQKKGFKIVLFTGDTRGDAKVLAKKLGIELMITSTGKDKKLTAKKLNPQTCVTIGNGLIDLFLFKVVKLSIVTVQAEGAHIKTIMEADILVTSILDALDLLLDEKSLIATLRP